MSEGNVSDCITACAESKCGKLRTDDDGSVSPLWLNSLLDAVVVVVVVSLLPSGPTRPISQVRRFFTSSLVASNMS